MPLASSTTSASVHLSCVQDQLPAGLDLLSVEEAPVKRSDGSNGEKMSQLMESVEYYLVLERVVAEQGSEEGKQEGREQGGEQAQCFSLAAAVSAALAAPEFVVERRSKHRGRTKVSHVDLKWGLQELEACSSGAAAAAGVPLEVLGEAAGSGGKSVVRVRTACGNGNPVLTPAMVVSMLDAAVAAAAAGGSSSSGSSSSSSSSGDDVVGSPAESSAEGGGSSAAGGVTFVLTHIHRSDLRLKLPSVPQPDYLKLRSILRWVNGLGVVAWPLPIVAHTLFAVVTVQFRAQRGVLLDLLQHRALAGAPQSLHKCSLTALVSLGPAEWRGTLLQLHSAAAGPGPLGWRTGRSWSRGCMPGIVTAGSAVQHWRLLRRGQAASQCMILIFNLASQQPIGITDATDAGCGAARSGSTRRCDEFCQFRHRSNLPAERPPLVAIVAAYVEL
jgi:hypothetical protein